MVKVEAIMTQLLFEHALRIRLKAEGSKEMPGLESASSPAPEVVGQAAASDTGGASTTATLQSHNGEGSSSTQSEEATLRSGSTSANSAFSKQQKEVTKGKTGEAKSEPMYHEKGKDKKVSKNLVGKINNLATSDLRAISGASDIVRVCIMAPFQIVLCLWFLYAILGWRYALSSLHLFSVAITTFYYNSAFVGFGMMVALMPLPTLVAKHLRKIQSEAMRKKDARIQVVTESKYLCCIPDS
jgi:hypothetical protein